MAIKLKRKKQINKRIMLGFLIVLSFTLIISSGLYVFISKQYMIRQTKQELRRVAETSVTSMLRIASKNNTAAQNVKKVRLVQELALFNEVLGTEVIVLSENGSIFYPRDGWTLDKLKKFRQTAMIDDEKYIYYYHSMDTEDLPYDGIFLYKKYDEVQAISFIGIVTLLISFGIGFVLAMLLGIYISQKIHKPIKNLSLTMEKYMKNPTVVDVYESGDEIEDLSMIFKELTDKVNRMDKRQKIFFQNSSHELKTPLMSIQGYAEAIKDGIINEDEMDKSLDIIISETQRLKNIVDDVIYLSKIDGLEDTFHIESCSVKHIIDEALLVVEPMLVSRDLDFEMHCEPDIMLSCDFDKMKRVFINLISNGTRYAKNRMVVNVHQHDEHLVIDVIDDGDGFEYGQEEMVFDRFYKGQKGGSGIGLALSKEIIEKHGGTIQAINHMNFGAVFKIEFR